jgi:mannose-1-phosphate guanylyltransferase/mannose-6-phosphate isomerase
MSLHGAVPVILCGGSGTRLWPLSRTGFPKQFLCLSGEQSLFQGAAHRLAMLASPDVQVRAPLVVTGEDHRFLATEQLREVGIEPGPVLLEPAGRNESARVWWRLQLLRRWSHYEDQQIYPRVA